MAAKHKQAKHKQAKRPPMGQPARSSRGPRLEHGSKGLPHAGPGAGRGTAPRSADGQVRLERLDEMRWRIPREQRSDMRVDGMVFASDVLMASLRSDPALQQVANVATLPGIVAPALAMPDIHWGYGFPIGGVAAVRLDEGVVSPGGIGFDINCGVRLLRSDLSAADIEPLRERLTEALFAAVPSGVGASGGRRLTSAELDAVLREGAPWVIGQGMGWPEDLERTEEGGRLESAAGAVSGRARQRGAAQLGTLGSGNHFLEVDRVAELIDPERAGPLGLFASQVVIFIHCGSRGLGHQVCTDHVAVMDRAMARYGIDVPDRQLACAPVGSNEGRDYLEAMAAASNFAWANRQAIAHAAREAFAGVFGRSARSLGLGLVYDVSHNIAKLEEHDVEGRPTSVLVHRKGATRALPPGHAAVPDAYREVGQPVLIPGDMGRCSYVAVGDHGSMEVAFGSTCHGAGRALSRHAALRRLRGVDVARELADRGILVRAERPSLLAEEASLAYKDVREVVRVSEAVGLIRAVARLEPMLVVKG